MTELTQAQRDDLATAIEQRALEVYSPDVFIPPTPEDFDAINALLKRERGHQLDAAVALGSHSGLAGAEGSGESARPRMRRRALGGNRHRLREGIIP